MKTAWICLLLPLLIEAGELSYPEAMSKAEKLVSARYEKGSRSWKIVSGKLDQILNSQSPEKEKIQQLQKLIQELEKKPEESGSSGENAAELFRRGEAAWKLRNFREAEELLLAAQKKGSAQAALLLGDYYADSGNRDFNGSKAERFYAEAAKGKVPGAERKLVLFCMESRKELSPEQKRYLSMYLPFVAEKETEDSRILYLAGKLLMETDSRKAVTLLKKALEKRNPEAAYLLGNYYSVSGDASAAYLCYKRGKELGHNLCRMMQAICCFEGKGCPENHLLAYELLETFSRKNSHPEACSVLGALFYEGRVVGKDYKKARAYLEKGLLSSNKLTSVDHFYLLGCICCDGGYGTKPEPEQAVKYLRQTKCPEALMKLGYLYLKGTGVGKDEAQAAACFRKAADSGLPAGMVEFGLCASRGIGMRKDPALAYQYFLKAAEQGNSGACRLIATLKLERTDPAYKVAYRHLRRLAGRGNAEACLLCGKMCHEGLGMEKNELAAMQYWRKCAALGNSDGAYLYAEILLRKKREQEALPLLEEQISRGHLPSKLLYAKFILSGKQEKAVREKAIRILTGAAEEKNHEAMLILGDLYYNEKKDQEAYRYYMAASGLGSYPSGRVALILFRKGDYAGAARQANLPSSKDSPEAMLVLGRLTLEGKGTPPDRNKALEYLLKALKTKDPYVLENAGRILYENREYARAAELLQQVPDPDRDSLLMLGRIFLKDRKNLPADTAKALSFLNRAATKGSGEAMMELGTLFQSGTGGVPLDYSAALEWYESAIVAGVPEAERKAAMMYYHGLGVTPDFNRALEYFKRSAGKGDSVSIYYLSKMYQDGIGVPKNKKEAEKWRKQLYRK